MALRDLGEKQGIPSWHMGCSPMQWPHIIEIYRNWNVTSLHIIIHTMWGPLVVSWVMDPINYRYIYHKPYRTSHFERKLCVYMVLYAGCGIEVSQGWTFLMTELLEHDKRRGQYLNMKVLQVWGKIKLTPSNMYSTYIYIYIYLL